MKTIKLISFSLLSIIIISCTSVTHYYSSDYSIERHSLNTITNTKLISTDKLPGVYLILTDEVRNSNAYKFITVVMNTRKIKKEIPISINEAKDFIELINDIISVEMDTISQQKHYEYIIKNNNNYLIFNAKLSKKTFDSELYITPELTLEQTNLLYKKEKNISETLISLDILFKLEGRIFSKVELKHLKIFLQKALLKLEQM